MTDPRKRTSALVTAAIIVLVLALPGSRSVLEGRLATHVLIQMPLLVLSGWLVGQAWSSGVERWMRCWNAGGIPGLLAVMFVVLFWMLPRSVDGAIQQAHLETAKFISLPLAGVLFALSFSRAPPLLKGAIKANAISMCLVLAWVYHAAPVRLCTSYLASDQQHLGTGFALWAAALSIVWGTPLMFGPRRPIHQRGHARNHPDLATGWPSGIERDLAPRLGEPSCAARPPRRVTWRWSPL